MRLRAQNIILALAACMFAVGFWVQHAAEHSDLPFSVTYKPIHSPKDIVALPSTEVLPIVYTRVTSLAGLKVATKKQKFIDMLLPAILISKQKLLLARQKLQRLTGQDSLSTDEHAWLAHQQQRFNAMQPDELLARMDDVPTSMVLAQAAIETGWGTSRFFLEGNNVFGVWSGNPREPRIKANESRDGTAIYVKKYTSLLQAVDDYFVTLGRGGPYEALRDARATSNDSLQLINHLDSYSELGDTYIERLRALITHNDLQRYDQARLAI